MSAKSLVAFQGLTRARLRFQTLADGLRAAGAGAADIAAERLRGYLGSVVKSILDRHELSGATAAITVVDRDGALVQIHGMPARNQKNNNNRSYASLRRWWPFHGDKLSTFALREAAKIYASIVLSIIRGEGGIGDAAAEANFAALLDSTEGGGALQHYRRAGARGYFEARRVETETKDAAANKAARDAFRRSPAGKAATRAARAARLAKKAAGP